MSASSLSESYASLSLSFSGSLSESLVWFLFLAAEERTGRWWEGPEVVAACPTVVAGTAASGKPHCTQRSMPCRSRISGTSPLHPFCAQHLSNSAQPSINFRAILLLQSFSDSRAKLLKSKIGAFCMLRKNALSASEAGRISSAVATRLTRAGAEKEGVVAAGAETAETDCTEAAVTLPLKASEALAVFKVGIRSPREDTLNSESQQTHTIGPEP
mmetsp:Transcript_27900/g.47722  ORF Transcript_27900/g.47722 Transcript_27900/m.47722 type:complete len:215 (-) Transcript_27900:482-1126(-)